MVMHFGILVFVLTLIQLATSTKIPVNRGTQRFIVRLHNSYRGKVSPPAANMQAMKWDQSLSNKAALWTRRCVFEHQMNGPGENLAYDTNRKNNKDLIRDAMKRFFDEYKQYTYGQYSCGRACHYTQMVWATTTRVGCAMERCPSMSAFGRRVSNAWYFACFYEPMGNINGRKPYIKGTPCSQCLQGQTCSNNVCRGRGSGSDSNGGTNTGNDNNTGDSGTQIGEQCRDDDRRCPNWSRDGECRKNPKWMLVHCKQSCGQCDDQTETLCTDKLRCCAEMRRKGHCLLYGDYMGEYCQKTCEMCSRRG